jgi:alkyldihydroxyacetonephosphate synthase
MRRWNGWGDVNTSYPLPESAARYLASLIGDGAPGADVTLEQALASVPAPRLPPHPLIAADAADRLLHARGQSLPDWVALRSGRIGAFPDGVAYPRSDEDVRSLLDFGRKTGASLIAYGGGTSVVGHVNPVPGDRPVLTLDLSHMDRLLDLDRASQLATFEAGVRGPHLEAQLEPLGYTLGHFPQSFELSTLGGWIATRSTGQQSYHYGRIEDHFLGGHLESFLGPLDLPPLPASAAGPDVRHFILGSEGRLGVLTRAIVRVHPRPESEGFYGVFFHDWEAGAAAVREVAQARVPVSMLRLSDAMETETTLALSGKDSLVRWADRGLRLLRYGAARSLLIYGVTGREPLTLLARRMLESIARHHGGLPAGGLIGRMWRKSRFLTPYLRNTLWERGYALDTVETAVPWSAVEALSDDVRLALRSALTDRGERVLAFTHLSHIYPVGASVYTTFLWRRGSQPDETLDRWKRLKAAASETIVAHGGTISHQHGVGIDHGPYLAHEKGAVGLELIRSTLRSADPEGLLNPGKLLMTDR